MQVFLDHVLTDVDVHLSANLSVALELNHFNAAFSAFFWKPCQVQPQRRNHITLQAKSPSKALSDEFLSKIIGKFLSVRPVANGRDGRPDIKKQ